ncbi:MAG: hypothetical protein LAN71_01040 [Acidobacteriia bacterium]|nr:hypothetical protein [Terriglobia bacterium]
MQSEMQSGMEEMKKEMADLEREIAAAKKQNKTEEAQELQQQLDMMKKNLPALQGGLKKMQNAGPKDWARAAEAAGPAGKIPRKDAARIASVPRNILTDTELKAHLAKVRAFVQKKIASKKRTLAEQIYHALKEKYPASAKEVAASANGLWISRQTEMALWMMGKAVLEDANPDNLNNYGAFLVMSGGEQLALPLLMKLNQQFPDNSTILNNIGQAWFGLGDLEQSKKYLDQASRFFAVHSQANYTEALIEEAKGNKPAAIAAIRNSLRESYSQEREAELQRLGRSLSSEELHAAFHMPQDPLGLHKFMVPRYPHKMEEVKPLEKEWDSFHAAVSAEASTIYEQIRRLQPKAELGEQKNLEALQAAARGQSGGALPYSPYARKGQRIVSEATQDFARFQRQFAGQQASLNKQLRDLEAGMNGPVDEIVARYAEMPEIEGMDDAECAEQTPFVNKFLHTANVLMEESNSDMLTGNRRFINETTYGLQYLLDDASFEVAKLEARKSYLDTLLGLTAVPWCADCGVVICPPPKEVKDPGRFKLADFEDLHCPNRVTFNFIVVSGDFECNKATLKYNAIFIKGEQVDDLNTGKTLRGNMEIMISTAFAELPAGPLKAEAKIGAGVFIEYDNGGVTDVGVKVEAKAELGVNLPEHLNPPEVELGHSGSVSVGQVPSIVEAGVEGKVSINAGPSGEYTGVLAEEPGPGHE